MNKHSITITKTKTTTKKTITFVLKETLSIEVIFFSQLFFSVAVLSWLSRSVLNACYWFLRKSHTTSTPNFKCVSSPHVSFARDSFFLLSDDKLFLNRKFLSFLLLLLSSLFSRFTIVQIQSLQHSDTELKYFIVNVNGSVLEDELRNKKRNNVKPKFSAKSRIWWYYSTIVCWWCSGQFLNLL